MSNPMFGLFAINQENETDFNLTFQIPDNCSYEMVPSGGTYLISIKLNPGQNEPSTVLVGYEEPLSTSTKMLNVNFEQHQKSGVIIKKPKIGVEL